MRTIRLPGGFPDSLRGACVALGNFDGLHAGHRAVIAAARSAADRLGGPAGVATFDPAPRRLFQPDAPPFRILTDTRRDLTLAGMGLDACFLVPFDRETAAMTDSEFVDAVLVDQLGVRAVAVGFDFQFGRKRMGDVATLTRLGDAAGFETLVVSEVDDGGEKLSSTRIRQHLSAGEVEEAARQLGQYWIVDAVVEHGEKRGRTLGYPTANMQLGDIIHPAHGIYAVWVRIDDEDQWRPGVANFGRTPTTGLREPLLEAVIFDFSGDLYGRRLHTAFASFLRPELKFDSLEALVAQMDIDAADARSRLGAMAPPPGL